MYAIVKTGGKQYRVEQGQTLLVELLHQEEGATVALELSDNFTGLVGGSVASDATSRPNERQ